MASILLPNAGCLIDFGLDNDKPPTNSSNEPDGERHFLVASNALPLNALPLNGLALNALPLNALPLNALPLNALALNALPLNALPLNALALNALPLNGLALNALALNALPLNALALNALPLNALPLNALPLNALALNALPLNSFQQADAKMALEYIVHCALPAGDSVTVTDFDGVTQIVFHGSEGLDPGWKDSEYNVGASEAVAQCISNQCAGDTARCVSQTANLDTLKKLYEYIVSCALASGDSITIDIPDWIGADWTFNGMIGLAPNWKTNVPTESEQRKVSACLGARTNAKAHPVRLSIGGAGMAARTKLERGTFTHREGAFFGNMFGANPKMFVCADEGEGIDGRVCTENCGFTKVGACTDKCTGTTSDRSFTGCVDSEAVSYDEVITVHLPLNNSRAVAGNHNCQAAYNGDIYCVGSNSYGQWGVSTPTSSATALKVLDADSNDDGTPDIDNPIIGNGELVTGWYHTCRRGQTGALSCFGRNRDSQNRANKVRGNDDGYMALTDAALSTGFSAISGKVASFSAPFDRAMVTTADGKLYQWGNVEGFGGTTDTDYVNGRRTSSPEQIDNGLGSGVARVVLGELHACALTLDGKLYCWGQNNFGQVGTGVRTASVGGDYLTPQLIWDPSANGGVETTDVCLGYDYTCVTRSDGKAYCWGRNNYQNLGFVTAPPRNSVCGQIGVDCYELAPKAVSGTISFAPSGLTCFGGSSSPGACAIDTNGKVYCWGRNDYGQLGINNTSAGPFAPTQVTLPARAAQLNSASSSLAVCATLVDGRTYCWGNNSSGQAGTGTAGGVSRAPNNIANAGFPGNAACGNGVCQPKFGENTATCAVDCGNHCGDYVCASGETSASCAADCPVTCVPTTENCTNGIDDDCDGLIDAADTGSCGSSGGMGM